MPRCSGSLFLDVTSLLQVSRIMPPVKSSPQDRLGGSSSKMNVLLINQLADAVNQKAGPSGESMDGIDLKSSNGTTHHQHEEDAQVFIHGQESFRVHSTVFNGVVNSTAACLVRPRTAQQVSRLILFCKQHNLELSVKAGGYGTHGWSVAGTVILDLSLMNQVTVALPAALDPQYRDLSKTEQELKSREEVVDAEQKQKQVETINFERGVYAGNGKRNLQDLYQDDYIQYGNAQRKEPSNGVQISPTDCSTVPTRSGRANIVNGKLDEMSKKSMMDALAGPTEYSPDSSAAVHQPLPTPPFIGYPISTIPSPSLTFGSSAIPYGSGDTRWQFGNGMQGAGMDGLPPFGTSDEKNQASSSGSNSSSSKARSSSSPSDPSTSGHRTSATSIGSATPKVTPPPHTLVTFGAGARAKEVDKITHASEFGSYHVPFAAFPVGSAVMMSGGFGFLSRLHGLSMDNLVEVEIVLADGRIVWLARNNLEAPPNEGNSDATTSAGIGGNDEDGKCTRVEMPDGSEGDLLSPEDAKELWWALRGAGTTFGVATRYRAKAYHVPVVYAGNLI